MGWEKVWTTKDYAAVTIDTGELTLNEGGICYLVDGEGSANDDLDTITGGVEGQPVILKADAVTITLKHGTGNITLSGGVDLALAASEHTLLIYDGTNWCDMVSAEVSGYVTKALFDANTILAANSDNTPAAVTIDQQRVVGRVTGGNIAGLTIGIADDNIVQIDSADAADNDFAYFTANGLEGKNAAETAALLTTLLPKQMVENDPILMDAAMSDDEKYCGICRAGTAGATLAVGDAVYYAVADGRWELADADAAATAQGAIGICVLAAANDGDPTTILLWGFVRSAAFPAFTAGAPVYLSTTDGDLTSTAPTGAGDIIRCVGQAWTAEDLFFNPSPDFFEHV